eukprot:1188456-Amphidinium_carterae.5
MAHGVHMPYLCRAVGVFRDLFARSLVLPRAITLYLAQFPHLRFGKYQEAHVTVIADPFRRVNIAATIVAPRLFYMETNLSYNKPSSYLSRLRCLAMT